MEILKFPDGEETNYEHNKFSLQITPLRQLGKYDTELWGNSRNNRTIRESENPFNLKALRHIAKVPFYCLKFKFFK